MIIEAGPEGSTFTEQPENATIAMSDVISAFFK
jgi:hypothetical protein